jgi:hypothetical protein
MRFHSRAVLFGLAASAVLVLFLSVTDSQLSLLEDETTIVVAANAPVAQTLELFATGQGQHEHPPLSDLLLHFWLPVAAAHPSLLRLPSMIFYAIGLVVFAAAAGKLAGIKAFYSTLLFGMVWPFGFHFGRLVGWYSFTFLLVALLTWAYLYFLEKPSWPRWLFVLCGSLACITANYFCWAMVGLFFIDTCLSVERRKALLYTGIGFAMLSLAYGPLWITFLRKAQGVPTPVTGHGIVGTILNAGFNLYSLLISESVAPWFWVISIPASITVGIVLLTVPFEIAEKPRRFYIGFLILFGLMAMMGIIGTKRLLFICGWFLIAIGCAVANPKRPRLRAVLIASLLFTVIVGWAGIISRKYYSALHFVEPWRVLAREAAQNIGDGQVVISNSPSFLFYLHSSLRAMRLSSDEKLGWAAGPGVISLVRSGVPGNLPDAQVVFVRGVNTSAVEVTAQTEEWLRSSCLLKSSEHILRDTGFELKKRFFSVEMDDPYRITVEHFDCRRY